MSEQNSQWFLEVEGHRTGPYSLEHLLGLAQEGEILAHHLVTAPHLQGRWITVQELVAAAQGTQSASGHFIPPPRPAAVELSSNAPPLPRSSNDPAANLFDALQAFRNRNPAKALGGPNDAEAKGSSTFQRFISENPQVPLAAIAVVLTCVITWTLVNFAKKAPLAMQQAATPAPASVAAPIVVTQPADLVQARSFSVTSGGAIRSTLTPPVTHSLPRVVSPVNRYTPPAQAARQSEEEKRAEETPPAANPPADAPAAAENNVAPPNGEPTEPAAAPIQAPAVAE